MINLVQILKDFLSDQGIEPDSQLFVACSGGVDSMVLLSMLLELNHQPEVVHCNFGLRGTASEADQVFIEEFASENGLNFHSRSFNTADYANRNQLSIQMAARTLRYEFFEELLLEADSGFVMLGHHADDSLETIFMNLGRGTGLMPLSGISPVRGPYLRPLWLTPKKDIIQYAVEHKIRWREDMSNREDNYQRNYIRHHLVTPLKEAFPEFDKGFTNTLRHTNDDRILFQLLIDSKLNDLVEVTDIEERFPLHYLRLHREARALVFHWLKKFGVFDFAGIESALDSPVSGKIFECEQGRLLVDRDLLVFRFKTEEVKKETIIKKDTEKIHEPLLIRFEKRFGNQYTPDQSNLSVSLDLDVLKFPLTLRKWNKGDRFIPLGMTGTKKLSDYFIDAKVNRFDKENTWVLCSGDDICWVVGHRPDDRYKVTDKTKNTYFAQVINDHEDQ